MVNKKRFIHRLVPLVLVLALLASTIPIAWNNDVGSAATTPGTTNDTQSAISAGVPNTVEVVLFGPAQYNRTAGKPNVYTDTFPAIEGEGWITIINGDEYGEHVINSSIVKVNGNVIFTTSDFDDQVALLEAPVILAEENEITVELRSEPGAYLTIQITQEIEAEAGAVIGPEGGVVEVTDPNYVLHGLTIVVPPGALGNNTIMSVEPIGNFPELPEYVESTSTAFEVNPDGISFPDDAPVQVTIPCNIGNSLPTDFIYALMYDDFNNVWERVRVTEYDRVESTLTIETPHFSKIVVAQSTVACSIPLNTDPVFNYGIDRYPIDQQGGECNGISVFTTWYFKEITREQDYHLNKHYCEERTIADLLAEEAQSKLWGDYMWRVFDGDDREYVAKSLWLGLKYDKTPQLLNMRSWLDIHMVMVYKYDGHKFYVQNSNYIRGADETIEVKNQKLDDYVFVGKTYNAFRFEPFKQSSNLKMQKVYNDNPPNDSDGDGIGDLCDKWALTQLTYTAQNYLPSISADGTKIAFISHDPDLEISIMNSDGSGLTQLTHNTDIGYWHCLSIGADGTKIAFDSNVDGDSEIFIINSDGTGLKQLTSNSADDWNPSISDDGTKIAFQSISIPGEVEIFSINSDGTGLKQLTSNSAWNLGLSISADGTKIAFTSDMDGDAEIFIINSDGTGLKQLTSNSVMDWGPSISADGTKIAFTSDMDGDAEIFIINSDGTGLKQLTDNMGCGAAEISADGTKIAFLYLNIDDNILIGSDISIMNSDGSGLTQLTHNTMWDGPLSISADGTKIAFQSSEILLEPGDIFLLEHIP